jgi:hypothetical protein
MMFEKWEPIKKYENLYLVSNLGRIKRLERKIKSKNGYYRTIKETIIKEFTTKKGYKYVCLTKNGTCFKKSVHRLVAKAFIPNLENKPQVNHIDGNKQNNHYSNLEWCTAKENIQHAIDKKLFNPNGNKNKFGKKHHNSNVIYQIKEGQVLNTFYGCYEAERKTGIDKSRINACCNGRAKTAGGYEWKYTLKELGLE